MKVWHESLFTFPFSDSPLPSPRYPLESLGIPRNPSKSLRNPLESLGIPRYPLPSLAIPFPLSHEPRGHQISIALWNTLQEIPPSLPTSLSGPKNYCLVNHHTKTSLSLSRYTRLCFTILLDTSFKHFMNPCKESVHFYCCFSTMIPPTPCHFHPSFPPAHALLLSYTAFSSSTQL